MKNNIETQANSAWMASGWFYANPALKQHSERVARISVTVTVMRVVLMDRRMRCYAVGFTAYLLLA